MKNTVCLFTFVFSAISLFAQGIPVSHTPMKKNVVLEIYGGIHCPACPQGDIVADQVAAAHPGKLFLINIHAGGYAVPNQGEPDYRTSAGDYLDTRAASTINPAGSINRHVFSSYSLTSGKTSMGRGNWAAAANQIVAQDAYANVGAVATIDVVSNLLTVNTQVYYTGAPPVSSNRLHVLLIQNNIEGPQARGYDYPENLLPNGNYNHQHVLRAALTTVSGKSISSALNNTVNEAFTYVIPDLIKNVPVDVENLQVVVFVTETIDDIINAELITPTFTNFPSANNSRVFDARIEKTPICGFTASPVVNIKNFGTNSLNSLYIDYSINGSPVKTFYWTGNLVSLAKEDVTLDDINFFPQATNTLTITTRLPNGSLDGDVSDDEKAVTFSSAPDVDNSVTMTLQLDYWGSEVTWEVVNSSGTELYSGGPYTNVANPSSNPPLPALITENFSLPTGDCYQFLTYDSYQDGILGTGTGFSLQDDNSVVIVANYANYQAGGEVSFGVGAPQPDSTDIFTGIKNEEFPGSVTIFPNPTSGKISLNLSFEQSTDLNIRVTNTLGQTVLALSEMTKSGSSQIQVDAVGLTPGIYFLNVKAGENYLTEKVLVTF